MSHYTRFELYEFARLGPFHRQNGVRSITNKFSRSKPFSAHVHDARMEVATLTPPAPNTVAQSRPDREARTKS